jgi:hypothetical protein
MQRTFKRILFGVAVTAGLSSLAQGRWERAEDRRELRQDQRETRDDRRDLLQVEVLLERFDAARAARRMPELLELDARLRELVRRELAEGRHELAKDAAELARAKGEVRRDEVALASGRPAGRAIVNDRRDRRDDRRDLREEEATQVRRRQIATTLDAMAGRVDPASLSRRRELTVAWRDLAVYELGQDRREKREDHR